MKHSHIFLLQIILLNIASNDGADMLDDPQDATKLIVLEPTTGKQWFLGPILVDFKFGALGACQHWSSATMPLQKPLSHASHSRHATTVMKERSDIFLLEVPSTPGEWEQVARGFEEIWQFPHCLGALDGKYVTTCPPQGTGAMYRNCKGTFNIVLMALVDSDLKFLYADVGRNGRMNDSGVWAATHLRARIDRGIAEFPKATQLLNSSKTAPFVIVGDEGFGMKPYLMRPFPASELEDAERIFNYR
ncbi:protein ALP1-like [Ixodes scapularis]